MLFNYSRKNIVLITLLISFIMFFGLNLLIIKVTEKEQTQEREIYSVKLQVPLEEQKKEETKSSWSLKIPKINLEADIEENTTEDVLNNYIGHFEKTSKWDGNVGLAAHNRGYDVNFFQNLKELVEGDEIEYSYQGKVRNYKVEKKIYIASNDWRYLTRENQNKLTLITCVENQPKYRLCVQAVEI